MNGAVAADRANGSEPAVPSPGSASPVSSSRISIQGVGRQFASRKRTVHALGPIDLEVPDGEFLCIVGPSGCGKSTLLRIIAGLITPSTGTIGITHTDPARALTGMVFQDHSIYPWKTVAQNVRFALDVDGRVPRKARAAIVDHYLRLTGLEDFAGAYPDTLSGGMRQRVSIARALAIEPEIVLMDEPFASLDAQMRTIMQDDLLELWESDRRTVVFITHSIEEAIVLGDRIVVMSARPGVIREEYVVPFGRPRRRDIRGSAEFAALHETIWEQLRIEVQRHLRGDDGDAGDDAAPALPELPDVGSDVP